MERNSRDSPIHLRDILLWKMATLMVKNEDCGDCFLWHGGSSRPQHESVSVEYLCSTFTMWFVRNVLTNGFWCLASELQQCAILSSPKCGEVIGRALHLCICLNRFGPSNFFLFPRPKITLEGEMISSHHRATTPCNIAAAGGSKTDLPRALKSGRIAKFQRIILWRRKLRVGWKCFRFPAINSVTDIFDQLS
jgi:hypothetical protein